MNDYKLLPTPNEPIASSVPPNYAKLIAPFVKKRIENDLGFQFHSYETFSPLNDQTLEGIFYKSLKDKGIPVTWIRGGKESFDMDISGTKVQVKGTFLEANQLELSSFRLGESIHGLDYANPVAIKESILEKLNICEKWYILIRKPIMEKLYTSGKIISEEMAGLKVWFYECDKSSFLYEPNNYNFKYVFKQKKYLFENKMENEFRTIVKPSLSHQLWYYMPFEFFQGLKGVNLIDTWDFYPRDLPKEFKL